MLTFQWDDIKENGLSLEQRLNAESLPEQLGLELGSEVVFAAPLDISLRIVPAGDFLEVLGRLSTVIETCCSRCLKSLTVEMSEAFELSLTRDLPRVTDEEGAEVELSAEDMGLVVVGDDDIDLRPQIAEQLVMALPYRVLCDEACRGICPVCGVDLNQGVCRCEQQNVLNPFAALKDFKVDKS